jgi:hypothetical protein
MRSSVQIRRHERGDGARGEDRKHRSGDAAGDGQQQAFGQELPRERAARRAERQPDARFTAAPFRAGDEQPGDVGAAEQGQTAGGAEQQQEPRARRRGSILAQPPRPRRVPRAERRQLSGNRAGDRRQLGIGLLERHAVGEPRDREQVVPAAIQVNRLGDRQPEIRRLARPPLRKPERWRHDADDAKRAIVEEHRSPEDRRIGAEALLPEAVAEHGDVAAFRHVVIGPDRAADQRRDAHDVEEPAGDARGVQLRRVAAAGQVHGAAGVGVGRHRGERRRPLGPDRELVRADRVAIDAGLGTPLPDGDEPVGVRVRQRAQQHRVGDAEHRRCRADSEGHEGDDGERERGRASQHTPGLSDVGEERTPCPRVCARHRAPFPRGRHRKIQQQREPEAHCGESSRASGALAARREVVHELVFEPRAERAGVEAQRGAVEAVGDAKWA